MDTSTIKNNTTNIFKVVAKVVVKVMCGDESYPLPQSTGFVDHQATAEGIPSVRSVEIALSGVVWHTRMVERLPLLHTCRKTVKIYITRFAECVSLATTVSPCWTRSRIRRRVAI